MTQKNIFISGCNGRIGHAVRILVDDSSDLKFIGGFDRQQIDTFTVATTETELYKLFNDEKIDVIIDFSSTEALRTILTFAYEKKIPIVIGTRGIDELLQQTIENVSKRIPIFQSDNMDFLFAYVNHILNLINQRFPTYNLDIQAPNNEASSLESSFSLSKEVMTIASDLISVTKIANGALKASRFLLDKKAGLYNMDHLF